MPICIRLVLELLCSVLMDNGVVTALRAETFRQAKFNDDRATEIMWKSISEIASFLIKTKSSQSFMMTQEADTILFVKSSLQNWGYLSKTFAELPQDMRHGSRELLVSLGWLLYSKDIIGTIIARKSSPLDRCVLPSYDLGLSRGSLKPSSRSLSPKQQLQRQLVLCGKLRLSLRRLYSSLQQKGKLKRNIHQFSKGTSLQPDNDHLTPFELHLLCHPRKLGNMYQNLNKDSAELKNLLDWKDKENIFWEWMGSALSLHHEESKSQGEIKPGSLPNETDFLCLPLWNDISQRDHLMEFILNHEEEMYKMDQIIANKKTSHEELEIVRQNSEKELAVLCQKFSEDSFDRNDNSSNPECSLLSTTVILSGPGLSSTQSGKRNKKTEIIEKLKDEIKVLQQEVMKLENELKVAQLNNVHKFQNFKSGDENVICIFQRY